MALSNNSTIFANTGCDTGPLGIDGSNSPQGSGLCSGLGGTFTSGENNPLGVQLTIQDTLEEVTADHTSGKHEGHTLATSTIVGLAINANSGQKDKPTEFSPVMSWSEFTYNAEAECQANKHNVTSAGARAAFDISNTTNNVQFLTNFKIKTLTPSGSVNESFTVFVGSLAVLLILNEQHVFQDGGFAWIRANGVHIIATDPNGTVVVDLAVANLFAGIHCAEHLPTDDAIRA